MRSFVYSLLSGLTLAACIQAQDTGGDKAEPDKVMEGERESIFTMRYLRLKNDSSETLTVFVQYRTVEDGKWAWKPGDTESGMALSFEVVAGKELVLEADGAQLAASRVRMWANGTTLKFTKHRDKDLWLVPEVDGDVHRYKAASVETFTFTFTGAMAGEPGAEGSATPEPALPEPPAVPLPEPLPPLPPPTPMPLPPLDPGFPPPGPKPADLGAEFLKVDKSGAFTGTIRNFGPGPFVFGRQWFLLRYNKMSGSYQVVKQGLITPMLPLGKKDVGGSVGPITEKSKFILAVTAGDEKPFNDKTGVVLVNGPESDLAITDLQVAGKWLKGKITNHGPDPYKGSRTYTLGSLIKKTTNSVSDLNVGQSQVVLLDIDSVDHLSQTFKLTLTAGDNKMLNDAKSLPFVGKHADLAVIGLVKVANKATATVKNVGDNKSGLRTLTVSYKKFGDASWHTAKVFNIAPKDPGSSQAFLADLPPLTTHVRATVNHVLGDNAANDQKQVP